MVLNNNIKTKVAEFVDTFMRRYIDLRSQGMRVDAVIDEITACCKSEAGHKWDDLTIAERIMQWGNLSFTEEISTLDPTRTEEEKIVEGVVSCMKIVCPEKQGVLEERARWAKTYLKRKYNIG